MATPPNFARARGAQYTRSMACRPPIAALLLPLLVACGGGPATKKLSVSDFDAPRFLGAFAEASTGIMKPEPEIAATLADSITPKLKGAERRELERRLARARLAEAETAADLKQRKKTLAQAMRSAERAQKGESDGFRAAEAEFLALWIAWRSERPTRASLAEAFTRTRSDTVELYALAWALRGEIALEMERWDEAKAAFRALFGHIEHPLYAYALYRTAAAHAGAGEDDEQKQALTEAMNMGCARGARAEAMEMALLAAAELGERGRKDADGVTRPAACPAGGRTSNDFEMH